VTKPKIQKLTKGNNMKFIKHEDGNHYTEDNRFRIINKRLAAYRKTAQWSISENVDGKWIEDIAHMRTFTAARDAVLNHFYR